MILPIDFRALKELIMVRRVLEEVFFWKPLWTRGDLARGPCPLHGSSARSRSLSVVRGQYHCFKCHAFGDAVDLYCRLNRVTPVLAATELCKRFDLTIPRKKPR